MPRYRITIEYDGTPYVGWQVQANGQSIQGELEQAIVRFSGETVGVRGAGRTDAGVHATGQVAHFDFAREWEPFKIREAMNYHLKPRPIAVLDCSLATEGFDARFSATGRHYLYRILNRRALPALDQNRVWWLPIPLDAEAMHVAAEHLLGRHDFTTFRAAGCQAKSPVKTLDKLDVARVGDEIRVTTSARSFMHNQVRSMVGSLKLVGAGRWQPEDMARALAARDRAKCGPVAPPQGLYLTGVDYGQRSNSAPPDDDADDDAA
jgi:tRNA pseudouridine38-40 synthase